MGPWGQAPEQTSHFRLGAGKIQIRGNLVSANIWVWVLVGAANHTPYTKFSRPVHRTVKENFRFSAHISREADF